MILGIQALRAIRWYPQELRGKGMARAGSILGVSAVAITLIGGIMLGPVSNAKKGAARIQSVSNLKQMGLALHTYHDAYLYFPTENPEAKVPIPSKLSWRVQILNNFCDFPTCEEFHHDEPWDSPHNIKLLPRMPKVYLDPRFQSDSDREKGLTYYRGFVGPGSVLGAKPPLSLTPFENAGFASNTLLVVEAGEPVPWTKPEDPSFDENSPFGGPNRRDFYALFADGHVQKLRAKTDPGLIRKLINWQNTEPVNLP